MAPKLRAGETWHYLSRNFPPIEEAERLRPELDDHLTWGPPVVRKTTISWDVVEKP
jgi:hypothetical protein